MKLVRHPAYPARRELHPCFPDSRRHGQPYSVLVTVRCTARRLAHPFHAGPPVSSRSGRYAQSLWYVICLA